MVSGDEAAAGEVLHQRGWRKAFTVAEMVHSWDLLVTNVERGYDGLVDEYTNDLYSRNWLHEAWVLLPAHVLETWSPHLMSLDNRFRRATDFDDGLSLSRYHRISSFDPDAMWWWRRRPRVLIGDLSLALLLAGEQTTQDTDSHTS
ncbi:hypothetical protein KDL01_40060 [Actinospica durhamensis]|uniref:Uncharacterized protein n=2 Tax=Actinospica durhamensis TaxID=1508375 RepID=A0A941ITA9_9ACTN|nr:hypothetical protein [Actinospica durhamensis]